MSNLPVVMPSAALVRRDVPATTIIGVLALCGVIVSLMQTLLIPVIPDLPRLLDAPPADVSWVITATLLSGAIITPISGRLGDMYGKRRILLVSLVTLVVGSLLCAVSDSLVVVVVGRTLQGAAIGIIPLGISMIRDLLPKRRVGSAIAFMSATLGVGGAFGLAVGAFIAEAFTWQVIFWVSVALGVLATVAVLAVLPESLVRSPAHFDWVGAVGLSLGLVCLLLAVTKAGDWNANAVAGLLMVSALVFVVWGWIELRTPAPLVDLRVAARPYVLFTNLASIMVGFAMFGMSLTFPQLLMAPVSDGFGHGLSMAHTGLVLAPGGVVMMLLSPVSARISAQRGPRTTLFVGAAVIGLGYLAAIFLTSEVWQIVLAVTFIGGGSGIAYAAMPALIISGVPIADTGAANGLNTLMRSVGTSTSSAVTSVILAGSMVQVAEVLVPSQGAFIAALLVSAAACLVAMTLIVLIPRTPPEGVEGVVP